MNDDVCIGIDVREGGQSERALIEALYPKAFPDEDLLPLVRDLLGEDAGVLSLVGLAGEALAGHVLFTTCGIVGRADSVALLGPLAVDPDRQRRGIGSALIRAGLRHLEDTSTIRVCVLGDPAYYGRFGFQAEDDVTPPYPLPNEWCGAWQSLDLDRSKPPLRGRLAVPKPWRPHALWAP